MRIYRGLVPVDEFEHTLRLRGPVLCAGVEIGSPGFVEVWSLWDEEWPETIVGFRVVGEGQYARAYTTGSRVAAR